MAVSDILFAGVFGAAGILPLLLLRPVLANREKPGSAGFLFVIVGISLWSFGASGLQIADHEMVALTAFALRIAGPLVSASGFFVLMGEFTGLIRSPRRILAIVLTFAVIVQLLTWTNSLHHLVFGPDVSLTTETIRFEKMGIVWTINTLVNYAFNATAFLIGSLEVLRSSGIRRQQTVTIMGAAIPPIGLNLISQFWVSLPIDPTVLGFVATAFVMGWALYSGTFLDIVPVGRKQAIETMDDPVAIIDSQGRIMDSNPAARDLVDCGSDWQGMEAADFFDPFQEKFERFRESDSIRTEITIQQADSLRHLDLNISPIRGPQDQIRGRLVVLRDITELRRRERKLDIMMQVQSRVLRHNIRNDLQIVRGTSEVFVDELDGKHADLASAAVNHCDNLLAMSSKARTLETLLDEHQTQERFDISTAAWEVVETQRERFPDVSFTLDAEEACTIKTTPAVKKGISNLVENAAEHNNGDPVVTVGVSETEGGVTVTVRDNGPGIPGEELSVIERGTETALSHGSGLGLWIIDWVFDQAGADVEYETDHSGTCVTVWIPDRTTATS